MIMKAITRSLCKETQYAEAFDALNDRTPPVLITLKTRNMCICWAKLDVRFQIIIRLTVIIETILFSLLFVNCIGSQ